MGSATFVASSKICINNKETRENLRSLIWLRKFISELRVVLSIDGPVLLYCDNIRAIAQAKELKFY